MKRSIVSLAVLLSSLGGGAMAADEEAAPADATLEDAVNASEGDSAPEEITAEEEAPAAQDGTSESGSTK